MFLQLHLHDVFRYIEDLEILSYNLILDTLLSVVFTLSDKNYEQSKVRYADNLDWGNIFGKYIYGRFITLFLMGGLRILDLTFIIGFNNLIIISFYGILFMSKLVTIYVQPHCNLLLTLTHY